MREFFIWCSGASLEIVKRCDDKEITKYSNIGIVVFCVAKRTFCIVGIIENKPFLFAFFVITL